MSNSTALKAPFPVTAALSPIITDYPDRVPGQPSVSLDQNDVEEFLAQELNTPILDELYPRLWLVARKSGANIDPLHQQKVKGRDIVPVENPQLHLVWDHNKFYIKPLPECFLSHGFWTVHLSSSHDRKSPQAHVGTNRRLVALGFVRSYAHLVRHHSDFALAHDCHLIPENINWNSWCQFIQYFRDCEDTQVAKRYHYGQLRLSRLNWAIRLFQPASASTVWFYEVPYWSIQTYLQRIAAPLIFGFASISLVLSSMQVLLSSSTNNELGLLSAYGTQLMSQIFWVFSIAILFLSALVWILLFVIPTAVLIWQISWGFKNRGKKVTKSTTGV
ncbi:uncharacterized protein ASPGLDRAFT_66249 [Aspergillus glaucus CBS 516.65]|uniref:Uncharacterized protein n=1 Tax=Aspergillus glaucus CBS 516.65 TaxID=1160497 RepID=A0A1L9VLC8_ASPGL|nr:hypothetical protein ASPGLDRAFT_66249 [Aspergillus glaucus CBS 516.65]OJJ84729.1 hypothetical protein ASPGLDRAFT_66249 [Aspergillus glaucus CBS 516.65]